jgi:hypothetical protein
MSERRDGGYKGYFIAISGKSNTAVVIKFSYDILMDKCRFERKVVIEKISCVQFKVTFWYSLFAWVYPKYSGLTL